MVTADLILGRLELSWREVVKPDLPGFALLSEVIHSETRDSTVNTRLQQGIPRALSKVVPVSSRAWGEIQCIDSFHFIYFIFQ